ncbi:MAG: class I SAM-dependent methyltransferase [Pyrinomonadaceae bacterium]
MDYKSIYYPESKVGDFTNIDGTIAFYIRVHSLLDSSATVLDVGCGRGAYADDHVSVRKQLRIFKGKCKKVIGIDVDPDAAVNPFLDEFHLLEDQHWPVESESVDLAICDFVVEHLEDPNSFFAEMWRVLKPDGVVCIRTPNVISYFGLVSKLVPNRNHASVVSKVQPDREKADVFPTHYKCNTKGSMIRMLRKNGFDPCVFRYESEPRYLSFSRIFYYCGVIYQRYTLDLFKTTIFAFGKKLGK